MIIRKYKDHLSRHYVTYLIIPLIAVLVGSVLILASTPPTSRDALTHHLYVPKLWLANGSINPISYVNFSYYPMNLDLLYAIPLAFGNDIIPKYIHFAFALLTAWLIYGYLKDRINKNYALFGSLFFLSLPIIIKLSITVYVDLGVIFFSTASLLTLFKWAEQNKLRYLVLAGILCGLAAGTKYNALISIFLLSILTPIIHIRLSSTNHKHKSLRAAGYGILFLSITLITFSPWLIRNYSETGNPIYPLFNSLLTTPKNTTHPSPDNTPSKTNFVNQAEGITKTIVTRRSNNFATRKIMYNETWWQALLLPVRFFFEGQDDTPRYFDGKLSPFLLVLMFLALYKPEHSAKTKRELFFLFTFGWLFFFLTFFQEALRIRYISTAIPTFAILATFGLHNVQKKLNRIESKILKPTILSLALSVVTLSYNAKYIVEQFGIVQPLAFLTGKVTRDNYIAHFRPEYPVQKYANDHLPSNTKLLSMHGGRRGYYHDHPVLFDPNDLKPSFYAIIKRSNNHHDIVRALKQMGFTHMIIRLELFSNEAKRILSPEKIELLNIFLKSGTKQLAANEFCTLIELK